MPPNWKIEKEELPNEIVLLPTIWTPGDYLQSVSRGNRPKSWWRRLLIKLKIYKIQWLGITNKVKKWFMI